jgi:hypothetical protein
MTNPSLRASAAPPSAPDNGFFVLAPWWLLAIPGGVISWRTGGRAVVVLIAALAAIFFYFVTSLTAWRAGWEVGPRYIVALQPFLLPLIATALAAWRERPRLLVPACGLVLIGVVIYTASTVTLPSWPANGDSVGAFVNPLYQIAFRLLTNNAVAPNLASALGLHGVIGIVPMVVGILALVGYSIIEAGAGRRGLVLAALIAAVGISAFALVHTDAQAARAAEAGYARTLYPAVAQ